MRVRLTYLTGARKGQAVDADKPYTSLGRHPTSDVRFGPDDDLVVSSRHAAIVRRERTFSIRDLGSTNGTFVNGERVTAERVLADRDVIQLGGGGPTVSVTMLWAEPTAETPTVVLGGPPPVPEPGPTRPTPAAGVPLTPTSLKVQREVARQTSTLRRSVLLLVLLVVVLGGVSLWRMREADRQAREERAELLRQVDSLYTSLGRSAQGATSMRDELATAQQETAALRREIAAASDDRRALDLLRRQVERTAQQQQHLAATASFDASGIVRGNGDAVALVLVEFPDGHRISGTGFGVRTDATGGWVVTNRHVVEDSAGTRASRLGLVFNGSRQNFRATLVAVHPTLDLALLRVNVAHGIPVVQALGVTAPAAGEPAVLLGFPLGLDLPMGGDWKVEGVSASATLATVSRVLPDLVQLDGYGAQGASGSPVFDRQGRVAGVLFGGERQSAGRIVYAVPAAAIGELLAGVPGGS